MCGNRPQSRTYASVLSAASFARVCTAHKTPGPRSPSASISRRRSAAFTADAIVGADNAKNSRSCNFSRSHGGLPITQSNPPASKTAANVCFQSIARSWTPLSATRLLPHTMFFDKSASVLPFRAERIHNASCVISTDSRDKSTPNRFSARIQSG